MLAAQVGSRAGPQGPFVGFPRAGASSADASASSNGARPQGLEGVSTSKGQGSIAGIGYRYVEPISDWPGVRSGSGKQHANYWIWQFSPNSSRSGYRYTYSYTKGC